MAIERFDQTDRRAAIRKLELALGVSLKPVGRRRKWLKDEEGRSYWVIGGYGEWHGIPEEMMDAEIEKPSGGYLVIAMRHKAAMQIYIGSLAAIVNARDKLYRASKSTGDYQFTYRKRGTSIVVEQSPSIRLADLASFEYSDSMKASDKRVAEASRLFESLSDEQKQELLASLRSQKEK